MLDTVEELRARQTIKHVTTKSTTLKSLRRDTIERMTKNLQGFRITRFIRRYKFVAAFHLYLN